MDAVKGITEETGLIKCHDDQLLTWLNIINILLNIKVYSIKIHCDKGSYKSQIEPIRVAQ